MKRILLSCMLCFVLVLPGLAMSEEHEDNTSVSLYGRLWPKVTFTSSSDLDQKTDITDAISRLGVAANYKLTDTSYRRRPGGGAGEPQPRRGRP